MTLVTKTVSTHKVIKVVTVVVAIQIKANVSRANKTSQVILSSSSTKVQLINRDPRHKSLNKLLCHHPLLILTSGYSSLL